MTEDNPEQERQAGKDLRTTVRLELPKGVTASLRLPTGRTLYVTVQDISRSGACVIRRGDIEIHEEDEVLLEVSDPKGERKLPLPSVVRWVEASAYRTAMGLEFAQGPLLPGSLLDEYLDRTLTLPVGV